MRYSLSAMLVALCLIAFSIQSQAAPKGKTKSPQQVQKERLVLMPLRIPEEDKALQGAMETALVEGLQQKYIVFSGEQVAQKAREIFLKESRNTTKKVCDETRCMQNIAEAFQAELIATANVTKQDGGYFLALSVQNIFDNKVEYSKSTPCKGCDSFAVVDKLKELAGTPATAPVQSSQSSTAITEPIKITLPAVPVAPTVKEIADDADGQTWVEVVKGNTAEDYKMYLDSFPQGKYAKQAAEQKKKLEDYAKAKAKAKADAVQAEPNSWNTAMQSDTGAAYNAYLKQYPTGPHAVLAKIKAKKALEAAIEKIAPNIAANMVAIPGKNYELGKYEVTQKEWRDIMGSNPSKFSSCGDTCPVEQVSWDDIQTFLQKLNQKTGRQYRLPTETEWEYACYGGSQSEYCGSNSIDAVAWYGDNSDGNTHPVGQKQANGYGLYDMSGNVWEWMKNKDDNVGVFRGGSWLNTPQDVRAVRIGRSWAAYQSNHLGFRLARTLP